jgi:hypothetical protein
LGILHTLTTLKVAVLDPQPLQAGLDLVVGQSFVDHCVDGSYELSNRRMQIRPAIAESVLGLSISHDRLPLSCCQP